MNEIIPSALAYDQGETSPLGDLVKLVDCADLGPSGVTSVETQHGRLAVGIAKGEPFAVSDRCRHLRASLGRGRVTEEGCLECPWHGARYDVATGKMERGPQGAVFLAARELVRGYTNAAFRLKRYPVVKRDGVLYLDA
jgi:3-phenylpropionate/trans-cinnamate dioxygenase ferredoxin subunit